MEVESSTIVRHILISLSTLAILAVFLWALYRRSRSTDYRRKKPRKRVTLTAHLAPAAIIKTLSEALLTKGYKLEEAEDNFIRFSDEATATSWGFYYPIYLTSKGSHETELEIGIQSKAMQIGPVVKKHHQKLIEAVKQALSISS